MTTPWRSAAVLAGCLAVPAFGQEPPASPEKPATPEKTDAPAIAQRDRLSALSAKPIVPLRVQIVFTKMQGERKVASLPYTLICNADDPTRRSGRLRMGIEVPVPTQSKEGSAYNYRNVGTNVDCSASSLDNGRFKMDLTIEQSSFYRTGEEKARGTDPAGERKEGRWDSVTTNTGDLPVFRTFRTDCQPILRDGQTAQYTAATDPVSGEVVKIEVTVNVLK